MAEGASSTVPLPTLTDDMPTFRRILSGLDPEEQVNFMHGLPKREMRRLFDEGLPLTLAEMVGEEDEIVRHEGQNDLPPFLDRFEKHVVVRGGSAQGMNVQRFAWATGPGHFSLRQDGEEVWFDYTTLPGSSPEGWPAVVANDRGFGRLVYGGMVDRVRKVVDRMSVGRVVRAGKLENHYFMLYRR